MCLTNLLYFFTSQYCQVCLTGLCYVRKLTRYLMLTIYFSNFMHCKVCLTVFYVRKLLVKYRYAWQGVFDCSFYYWSIDCLLLSLQWHTYLVREYKYYTEMREECDNWCSDFWSPLEKYGALGRNEINVVTMWLPFFLLHKRPLMCQNSGTLQS